MTKNQCSDGAVWSEVFGCTSGTVHGRLVLWWGVNFQPSLHAFMRTDCRSCCRTAVEGCPWTYLSL